MGASQGWRDGGIRPHPHLCCKRWPWAPACLPLPAALIFSQRQGIQRWEFSLRRQQPAPPPSLHGGALARGWPPGRTFRSHQAQYFEKQALISRNALRDRIESAGSREGSPAGLKCKSPRGELPPAPRMLMRAGAGGSSWRCSEGAVAMETWG